MKTTSISSLTKAITVVTLFGLLMCANPNSTHASIEYPSVGRVGISESRMDSSTSRSSTNRRGDSGRGAIPLASVDLIGWNNVPTQSINAGNDDQVIWESLFEVNTRSLLLQKAVFKVSGSTPTDTFKTTSLYIDGVLLTYGSIESVSQGVFNIVFNLSQVISNPTIVTGKHFVTVKGVVQKGASYNFTVSLQDSSSFQTTDSLLGKSVTLGISGNGLLPNFAGTQYIRTGEVHIVQAYDPALTSVFVGTKNAPLARLKVTTVGEDVRVNALYLTVNTNFPTQQDKGLTNISLYLNGSQVGPTISTSTSGTVLAFTGLDKDFLLKAGSESLLEIRADLFGSDSIPYQSGSIRVTLNSAASNAVGQESKQSTNVPYYTVQGQSMQIINPEIPIFKNPGFVNQNISSQVKSQKIGSYIIQSNSGSEDFNISELNFNVTGNSISQHVANLSYSVSNSDRRASFMLDQNNHSAVPVNMTLKPGETATIDFYADINGVSGFTFSTSLGVSGVWSNSGVMSKSSPITGQTISVLTTELAPPTLVTSSSTVSQYIAVGPDGARDATRVTFHLTSKGGAATISELKFTVNQNIDAVTSVKVGSVSALNVNGTAWLVGLNIMVPSDEAGTNVDVLLSYAGVDGDFVKSGDTSSINLTEVKYLSGSTSTVMQASATSPTMTIVRSKPNAMVSSTTQEARNTDTVGKIGEVLVAADAKGEIKINDLVFDVSTTGFAVAATTIGSPVIKVGGSTVSTSSCTAENLRVTCEFGSTSNLDSDGFVIPAGTSVTFSLFGQLFPPFITSSSNPYIFTNILQDGFNWEDAASGSNSGKNLSGNLLYNFPVNPFTTRVSTSNFYFQVDKVVYKVSEFPLYTISNAIPNAKIFWSSTFNGASTGEVCADYGHFTGPVGFWQQSGGAWTSAQVGTWTKTAYTGSCTDPGQTVSFTVVN